MTAAGREHPLAKGSPAVENAPTNPPASHSAGILLSALALGILSYVSGGYINSTVDSLFAPSQVLTASLPSNNVVDLGYASYRGLLNDTVPDVVSWLGVPYAQPPRRFRAARPLDETAREHNVTELFEYPLPCIQGWAPEAGLNDRGGAGSEDCLKVNIYAPRSANNASSLPVLVYIHGGGYYYGNPRNWPFDNWVQRSPTPFVAVSIYYRLSVLGFLAAPESPDKGVHSGEDPELLLNAGIHDQRLALRFIQRHIRSFGGDPERVTIMGQSAGAGSVGLHIVAHNENPDEKLFHRAILQSWYRPPLYNPVDRKVAWNFLTKYVGCSHWTWSISRTLQCLREVDHVQLSQAADEGMFKYRKYTDWMWQPLLDQKLFNDFPHRLLTRISSDIDIIIGHTTHDSVIALPPFEHWARATYPQLSSRDIRMLENLYTQAGFAPERFTDVALSESLFKCGTYLVGNTYGSRAYTYRFDEPGPTNPERADHCADNYVLFEGTRTGSNGTTAFTPLTASQRTLSDEIISYFIAFAATGDPNSVHSLDDISASRHNSQARLGKALVGLNGSLKAWPNHTSGKRLVFRTAGGGTGASRGTMGGTYTEELDALEIERCRIWEGLASTIRCE
ncbi:Alpha/Beta hydrolase protein [Rhizoctonia solani]|nr:Alpha/Beta hydrolase protein [Rhizoctonia solani]